jgi:tripartite-type tricarboxylate transporter receptor subunit TctC
MPADGYTFFFGAIHHTIAPAVYSKLSYDIEKDFIPVTVAGIVPNVVVVHPKYPFKDFKDLVDYAKANPGKLNFASAGAGTSQQLAGELVKLATKTEMVHVPYKGMGPAVQDFIAGHVDLLFDGMGASAAQIKAGKAKPLGLMAAKRTPGFPDIPTLAEQGHPGLEVSSWYALWAIKGTPPEIVERFYKEVVKAFDDPIVKTAWANASAEFGGQPPAEFAKFIRDEIERWGRVAKAANIKVAN